MSFGLAPWHQWGNSQPLVIPPGLATRTSNQLAKISYKRPDTWNFLFAVSLISGPVGSASGANVGVSFDLTVGIGRSMVKIPFFCQFAFNWAAAAAAPRGQKWTTEARTPLRIPSDATSFGVIRNIVAEDIQCEVSGIFENGADPGNVTVLMDAYFAPQTHIRPDWYAAPNFDDLESDKQTRFRGQEMGGM